MKELSFLPRRYAERARQRRRNRRNLCLTLAMTGALGMLHVVNGSRIQVASAALQALDDGRREQSSARARLHALRRLREEQQDRARLTSRLDDSAPVEGVGGEITRLLGASMAIRGLELVTEPAPARQDDGLEPAGDPDPVMDRGLTKVTIQGVAPTDIDVGIFMGQLTASPLFDQVELHESVQDELFGRHVRAFEFSFVVRRVKVGT